jgi:glycosyltransferase involved in cell wall biosynthesis
MTVAILVWSRIWGGLESHVMDLAATALEDGHQVVVACVGADTAALFQGRGLRAPIRVINPPPAGASILAWYKQFRALGAKACIYEKGTLHAGSLSLDIAARAAFGVFVAIQQLEPPALGARSTKRHMGGLVPGLGLWWYRQRFRGWLRSLAPVRTICITEAVRSALATAYGFSSQRLPVIYNGVDTDRFSPTTDESVPVETPGAVPPFTFGTSARLEREKGIDVAIRAFAQVVRDARGVPMQLLIANQGSERAALEQLVNQLGVAGHVRFLGFQRDLPAYYRTVDIFLAPSRIEAQGLIVLEAMASGCLVVASAVGGIPEMVTRAELGTLVPPDDSAALANAMNEVRLLPPGQRRARAAAARAHVSAHFLARTQCRKVLSLVEQLAAHS